MQGTGYAIGEVIIFLVISAIIGFGVGWLLGRWTQRTTVGMEIEDQLTAERERTRQMEARLGERSRDLDGVRTELARAKRILAASTIDMALADQLVAAQEEVSRLEAAGQVKDGEIERLAAAAADLEQAQSQIGQLERELADLGAEIDAGRAQVAGLEASLAAAASPPEPEVAEPEPEPEVAEPELFGELTPEVVEAEPEAAEPEPVEEAEPFTAPDVPPTVPLGDEPTPEEIADLPGKEEATARVAEIAVRTAGEGPAADDDLKRVHGIGPKLERLLKDMGITSYRQIAAFRDDDITYVAAAIEAFPGRIERDDWMSSAAREHEKKYGEPPAGE